MPSTYQSIVIDESANAIWRKIGDFHDLSWAPRVISSCEKVGNINGHETGARRVLNGAFLETLTKVDPGYYRLEYSIDDGPPPVSNEEVSNYTGVIQLSPAEDGLGTLVEWSSSWESNTEDAVDFCHGIYVALLSELASSFE